MHRGDLSVEQFRERTLSLRRGSQQRSSRRQPLRDRIRQQLVVDLNDTIHNCMIWLCRVSNRSHRDSNVSWLQRSREYKDLVREYMFNS